MGHDVGSEFHIYIENQAEILAAKAVKGYCDAIYCCGEYLGETYDSDDLIYGIFDSDNYPSEEIANAVANAACALLEERGGPWCTEETYAAFTGADDTAA